MKADTDTYDAPVPPAEGVHEDNHDPFTLHKQDCHLDDLFWGHDESTKNSLISFIRTGAAPEDGARQLHNFCLSILYKEEGDDHANNDQKNSSLSPTPSQKTTTTITSTATTPLEEAHTPKLDDEVADPAQDLFNHLEGDLGVRTFFFGILASGKVSPEKARKLFDLSTLASCEEFSTIMEQSQNFQWVLDSNTGQHVLVPQPPMSTTVSSQGIGSQQLRQPQVQIQSQYNQRGPDSSFISANVYQSPAPEFHPVMNPNLSHQDSGCQSHGLPVNWAGMPMDMGKATAPHPDGASPHAQPQLPPGDIHNNTNQNPVSASSFATTVPARQSLPRIDHQNGEQNSVSASLARASPMQSERSVHPTDNVNIRNKIDTKQISNPSSAPSSTPSSTPRNGHPSSQVEVISCSVMNDDGTPCDKVCKGEHRYRSITEHIRRAHPKNYIQGLAATEESYKRMLDTQGVTCPILMPDGTLPCLHQCTGSKMWKEIIDHIRDTHHDHWIPGLPANKDSYNKMVNQQVSVECPLHLPSGSPCKKRCFGPKRWRSIQEHIRRNHRPYWIAGLKATEESFIKMTTRQPDPPESATPSTGAHGDGQDGQNGQNGQAAGDDVWSGSQGSLPLSTLNSPVVQLESGQPAGATNSPHKQQPSAWASPGENGVDTVSPKATLTMSEIDQHHSAEVMSAYPAQYGFPQHQQQVHPLWPFYQEQQQSSGLAHAAKSVIRQDRCLTDPLFDSARILGTGEAMQTNGNTASAGFQREQTFGMHIAQPQQPANAPMLSASGPNTQSSDFVPQKRKRTHKGTYGPETDAQEHHAKKQAIQQGSEAPAASPGTRSVFGPNLNGSPTLLHNSPHVELVRTAPPEVNGPTNLSPGFYLAADHSMPVPQFKEYHHDSQPGPSPSVSTASLPPRNGLSITQSGSSPAAVIRTPSEPNAFSSTQRKRTSRFFSSPTQPKQDQNTGTNRLSTGAAPGLTMSKRPPPNTISSLPFPTLMVDKFGLIQEEVAHDAFRLLIAVQFLVKTPGRFAIPVFHEVMRKWPTPPALADADRFELENMVHHLGLQEQRCTIIQRYARLFVENPPTKGVRYGVKGYPRHGDAKDVRACEVFGPEDEEHEPEPIVKPIARGHGTAWEIGHITAGPYAIDSWRIFCRDALLGRAESYRGEGRGPTFQPEWMRVQPTDKELKSYLRWMWMKEGWLWDPETGEKSVLSEEMRTAVNEGRVRYDEGSNLEIVADGVVDGGAGGVLNV